MLYEIVLLGLHRTYKFYEIFQRHLSPVPRLFDLAFNETFILTLHFEPVLPYHCQRYLHDHLMLGT